MNVDPARVRAFATPADVCAWLADYHASETELWMRLYKKKSGVPSVTWAEAVVEALAWGWIDGIKKTCDEVSWYQRFTPRKPRSVWSQINREHCERLIDEGRMQPPGLAYVEAARADGRWDAAYSLRGDMVFPEAFVSALAADAAAQAAFDALKRADRTALYRRLTTVRTETTRAALIGRTIAALRGG